LNRTIRLLNAPDRTRSADGPSRRLLSFQLPLQARHIQAVAISGPQAKPETGAIGRLLWVAAKLQLKWAIEQPAAMGQQHCRPAEGIQQGLQERRHPTPLEQQNNGVRQDAGWTLIWALQSGLQGCWTGADLSPETIPTQR
jgi:hypothetical protein